MKLAASQIDSLNQTAGTLQVYDPRWLRDLIYFETAGTFDPAIKNPRSSARGLIQFMDATARDMGYTGSLDLVQQNPTFEGQLEGPVVQYLRRYAPFNNEHELYMAVFYPRARKYAANTPFSDIMGGSAYANFIKSNPGILTPAHYVAYVKKKPLNRTLTIGSIWAAAAVVGTVLYLELS